MYLLTCFLLAMLLLPLTARLGYHAGLVDHPDGRKQHNGAIPLTGGLAIFLAFLLASQVADVTLYSTGMLVVTCAVFALGVFDDYRHIRPGLRLVIHFLAGALIASWGGIAIHNVGNLLAIGDIPLLLLTVPLTALSFAGLANACNMIDGIDGLAASLVGLPLLVLCGLALGAGHPMAPTLGMIAAPIAAFLLFNLGPNSRLLPRVFLGDGGSVTLGFLLTASLVYFSQGDNALIRPVTALWLVTVPLMDMLATMLRRLRRGASLVQADRLHLHHTLLDFGLGPRQTLLVMIVWAGLCAACGLALEAIPEYLSLALYFAVFTVHCLFVLRAGNLQQRLELSRRAPS